MNRFQSFLSGRYGSDSLSRATSILACVLVVASMFTRGAVSSVLWALALLCLVLTYYRMFSRNFARRRQENQTFLRLTAPVTGRFQALTRRRRQKKLYRFFKCPACGTVLRVPKGKGRIRITCKSCHHVFEETS